MSDVRMPHVSPPLSQIIWLLSPTIDSPTGLREAECQLAGSSVLLLFLLRLFPLSSFLSPFSLSLPASHPFYFLSLSNRFLKVKCTFTLRPNNPTSIYLPKRRCTHKDLHKNIHSSFIHNNHNWAQSRCSLGMNKLWHIHAKEYHLAVKGMDY